MQYFQKDIECMGRAQMEALQLERLQYTVKNAYKNVPLYKNKLDSAGVKPEDIRTLSDLSRLPFTVKDDLRDNYPFGMFAVPMKKIVRVHASSGTTGKPTVVGYTKRDLDMWSDLIARLIYQAGGNEDDITQIAFGYGLFTGAFGLHYGMEKVGCTVVPTSSGNTEKQIMLMQDFKSTILVATPSYALYIAEVMGEMGVTKDDLSLRIAMLGAEGHTEEMRAILEDKLGVLATENYGLSEVMGPGVAGECVYKCGQHVQEDCFIPEIIDPKTGEVLPVGEKGELVITTINKEGLPVLRYRTKDITWLIDEPCKCGRTLRRIAKIQGRSDDMLIIKGVNVFPSQVESVIVNIDHISPYYQLIVTKKGFTDQLEVKVEMDDASLLDSFSELEALEKEVKHKLHVVLGIDAKVRLVEPKSIERTAGKAKHVIDLR